MGGNWGCQGREQAGKAAFAPACGHPRQIELWWVKMLLHPSTWNQGRQRLVAGLMPPAMPEAQPGKMHPLCAKKRTEC